MISYDGIDEATLIHGLYHGTRALGMGRLHDKPALSVADVAAELGDVIDGQDIRFDYYHGRPLKTRLDTKAKTFNEALYDRDAGQGAAAAVVEAIRKAAR